MRTRLAVLLILLGIVSAGVARADGTTPPASAASAAGSPTKAVERCGWWDNPTPQNVWLTDRDAQWTISEMGGPEALSDDSWPQFKSSEMVHTNGPHGYGCACATVEADPATHVVVRYTHARVRPLKACRSDPALRRKEPR